MQRFYKKRPSFYHKCKGFKKKTNVLPEIPQICKKVQGFTKKKKVQGFIYKEGQGFMKSPKFKK